MSSNIIIRLKETSDNDSVAALIRDSLNVWYYKNRGFENCVPSLEAATLYSRVYDALDPGCCVVAEDVQSGKLAGSCFFHPRPTHTSLGIMTVAPEFFGQSVSSKLLARIVKIAESREQSLRLVSSAMNLDSFSLYNRAGFIPRMMFQDMQLSVPEGGFAPISYPNVQLRDAILEDVDAIGALDKARCGLDRKKDFRYFIENADGIWGMSVAIDEASGACLGMMASVNDPGAQMIGPGVAIDEKIACALIIRELNRRQINWRPIILVPTDSVRLRSDLYALGARNTETHIAQSIGDFQRVDGVFIPSFMPESA